MTANIVLALAAAILVVAALQDFFFLQISNLLPVALLLLFGAWVFTVGWDSSVWTNLLNFLVILGVGIGMFAMGWLGGGDAKLFAAISIWFGWPQIIWLVVAITLFGGLFTILLYFGRRILKAATGQVSRYTILRPKGPIPYGVAIAIGGIVCLYGLGPNPAARGLLPPYIVQGR